VNILELQVFVSLMLVAGAVLLFVFTVRARTFEHADRLALAPLEDDLARDPAPPVPSSISHVPAPALISSSGARTPQEGEQ